MQVLKVPEKESKKPKAQRWTQSLPSTFFLPPVPKLSHSSVIPYNSLLHSQRCLKCRASLSVYLHSLLNLPTIKHWMILDPSHHLIVHIIYCSVPMSTGGLEGLKKLRSSRLSASLPDWPRFQHHLNLHKSSWRNKEKPQTSICLCHSLSLHVFYTWLYTCNLHHIKSASNLSSFEYQTNGAPRFSLTSSVAGPQNRLK